MATGKNISEIQFGQPTVVWSTPDSFKIHKTLNGSGSSDILAIGDVSSIIDEDGNARTTPPQIGEDVDFQPMALVITATASTSVPEEGAKASIEGIVNGDRYIALYDSSDVELTGGGYARVSINESDWIIV